MGGKKRTRKLVKRRDGRRRLTRAVASDLANDLLVSAREISRFTGLKIREVYRNPGGLPFFHIGQHIAARRSTLLAELAAREDAARARFQARATGTTSMEISACGRRCPMPPAC